MKMQQTEQSTSLVLTAHGSRCGSAARTLEAMADQFREDRRFEQVLTGYHQGQPAFSEIPGLVSADGAVVVPVFLAEGYYSKKVLPRELIRNPRSRPVELWLTPVVGTDPRLSTALLSKVENRLHQLRWPPERTAVVVLGHGTPRSSTSRKTTRQTAAFLSDEGPCRNVFAAFLDDRPAPHEVTRGTDAERLLVLPFLFGGGEHADELAQLFGVAESSRLETGEVTGRDRHGRQVVIEKPIGEDPVLVTIVRDLLQSPRLWKRLEPSGGPVDAH